MNTLKTCLLSLTLALAGVAVDASAAEASCSTCFQLSPLSSASPLKPATLKASTLKASTLQTHSWLAEGGYERTPQGMRADNQA
ncbi:hypothetical protein PUP68_14970 [Pseudomonas chlororaphis]|uniref:hypothetical protein n=1 Tax=Pseudomonas chlororaphis TaxID=587753 RepID=UPI0006A5F6F5|nr:hypothetical protein [Pseudomonas chlororaphis]AZC30725.1 hypothetical protein C4K38_2765 [Pseudomonas chlororaphis subsp. piscium]WDG78587.1 hypothetical protein PUP77_29890 [Pseudomonas chlororaphis]WDG88362.1 hypothetical protein PUP68_14970 [Pseudomonas chlororaphis]WDG94618.1 hypothetical protein PUP49_14685 [Pseudomonas chlororaphis]SDT10739.1 hypothetical protein SAMN05216585_4610 [Pseudomonas chlororaphis]